MLIVRADLIGTVAFAVAAGTAAIVFSTSAQWFGAITSIALFGLGCATFLLAFFHAVQRSRTEQISVTQLFLLAGEPTPRRVRRTMSLLLLAQCLIAAATAFARPETADGSPGSSLALGFLVPMFGLGMNGLWAAFHGDFPPRSGVEAAGAGHDVQASVPPIDKNDAHG